MKRYIESYATYTNSKNDKFWGDKAAGILPIAKDTKRILLNLRSEYVNEPFTYGVYGGKLDSDDLNNVKKAAIREFEEESNYRGNIKLTKAYLFETPNKSFSYQNFIGIIDKEFEPDYDWESAGHLWVTLNELLDMIRTKPEKIHFGLKSLVDNSLHLIKQATLSY